MTTRTSLPNRPLLSDGALARPDVTLFYDGDCPFCVGASRLLVAWRLLDPREVCAFQVADGAEVGRLVEAGIRNELILVDRTTGEYVGGVPALARLLERAKRPGVARLLRRPPLGGVAAFLYRVVASHRRVLAPPPAGIVCACDPDPPTVVERIAFLLLWPAALAVVVAVRAARAGVTSDGR